MFRVVELTDVEDGAAVSAALVDVEVDGLGVWS